MSLVVCALFRQLLDNVLQARKRLVDVDRLLHPILMVSGSGLVETFRASQIDQVENSLARLSRQRVVPLDLERKDGM